MDIIYSADFDTIVQLVLYSDYVPAIIRTPHLAIIVLMVSAFEMELRLTILTLVARQQIEVSIATTRNRTGTFLVVVSQPRLLDWRRQREATASGIVEEVVAGH